MAAAAASKPELKLSAPAGGRAMPDIAGTVEQSRAAKPQGAVPLNVDQARVQALHDQAHAQHAAEGGDQEKPDDQAEVPPREDIDTIELTLPDGRMVVFGPPNGVSLTMRISMLLGERQTETMHSLARVCMCVRSLDGKPLPPIGNMVDLQKACNILGDAALDLLGFQLTLCWPPMLLGELPNVKKNLRGQ